MSVMENNQVKNEKWFVDTDTLDYETNTIKGRNQETGEDDIFYCCVEDLERLEDGEDVILFSGKVLEPRSFSDMESSYGEILFWKNRQEAD